MVNKSCAFLFLSILLASQAVADTTEQDLEVQRRLNDGEIVLLEADSDQSGGSARVQALVLAPAESVWAVITSCEQSFVFVDGLKSCDVIEDRGDRALVHQIVKKGWLVPRQDFVFESVREPYGEIRFNLVEGSLKEMEGKWRFKETAQGLLLDYEIRVRPSLPVPGFIVSWVMRREMPDLIACIRGLADGSGSQERVENDLYRCRGDMTRLR